MIFFLIISAALACAADDFDSERLITGRATQQPVHLGIIVNATGALPSISLTLPKNGTYLVNESLPLNYSSSGGTNWWYRIDGGTSVPLISGSDFILFNTSDGQHVLTVYANNTNGMKNASVTFIANSTRFIILYKNEYKTSYSGVSTDFYSYILEELYNLTGICLENVDYGKACFNELVNVTNDRIYWDNVVDIQGNTNISFNFISLDSYELPNFNVSSTLWLYNLSFINPRVLRNGEVCPSNICNVESYAGGILRFGVTGFTNYSAEETPSAPPSGGGGGGGTTVRYVCNISAENVSGAVVMNESCWRCNPPYILRGSDCCLDRNNNQICDAEEPERELPLQIDGDLLSALIWLAVFGMIIFLVTRLWPIILSALGHKKMEMMDNYLRRTRGLRVYSHDGSLVGRVESAYVEKYKVHSWQIRLTKKFAKNIRRKIVVVMHKNVESIKDVVILDAAASDYLERIRQR